MWIKCQNEQTWFNTDELPIASIAKQGPVEPKEGEVDITPGIEKFYIVFRNSNINVIYASYDTFEEAEKEFVRLMKKVS